MRAIVEVESPDYLLLRSQELIREGDSEALKKAISLLALHLVKDDLRNGHTPPGTRKGVKKEGKLTPAKPGSVY